MFYLGDTLVTADKTPVFFYVPNINQTTTMEKSVILISLIVASAIALMACPRPQSTDNAAIPLPTDTVAAAPDSVAPSADNARYERLTDEDYKKVADELGVDIATMKAVVEIEAGKSHKGFVSPGKPLINFDLTMFKRQLSQAGIKYGKYKLCVLQACKHSQIRVIRQRAVGTARIGAHDKPRRGKQVRVLGDVSDWRIQLEELRMRYGG